MSVGSKRSARTTSAATVSSQPRSCPAADLLCALLFGLNASVTSPLTLAKIHKVYHKTDSHSMASKQLGMSSHENVTLITRPARTLGVVVVGSLGVRVFCPRPVFTIILSVFPIPVDPSDE